MRGQGDEQLAECSQAVARSDQGLAADAVRRTPGERRDDCTDAVGQALNGAEHGRRGAQDRCDEDRKYWVDQLARSVLEKRHDGEEKEVWSQPGSCCCRIAGRRGCLGPRRLGHPVSLALWRLEGSIRCPHSTGTKVRFSPAPLVRRSVSIHSKRPESPPRPE